MKTFKEFSVDLKTGDMTITDEAGSKLVKADDVTITTIRDQHKYLCHLRDTQKRSAKQKEALDGDILVYEYILEHPDSRQKAQDYMEAMHKQREKHGLGVSKMKVAKMLGWFQ